MWFVMIYTQEGDRGIPMIDSETGAIVFYPTEDEARIDVELNHMAQAFGYKLFHM